MLALSPGVVGILEPKGHGSWFLAIGLWEKNSSLGYTSAPPPSRPTTRQDGVIPGNLRGGVSKEELWAVPRTRPARYSLSSQYSLSVREMKFVVTAPHLFWVFFSNQMDSFPHEGSWAVAAGVIVEGQSSVESVG